MSRNASVCRADLGNPTTLPEACAGIDCIVHFAGVLFAPHPQTFLPRTNLGYVKNLVVAARAARVRKLILISFPHVEGETFPDKPATDHLDRRRTPSTRRRGWLPSNTSLQPARAPTWFRSHCAPA